MLSYNKLSDTWESIFDIKKVVTPSSKMSTFKKNIYTILNKILFFSYCFYNS